MAVAGRRGRHRAGRPNARARPGASAAERRDATRPRPQRKGETLGRISSGGCHEGDSLPHAIPGCWGDIPRRRRRAVGARGGVGGERGTSERHRRLPRPPLPRKRGREGGRGRQSETKASAARRTKQDFGKQTQTSKPRSKKGKGGDTLGTPTERRHNSTWVETVTKSEDNKPKQAPLGGESALEVRRTWISK